MTLATGLDLVIEPGEIADMADVMLAMDDAFDPEFGEAWTEAQCAGVLGLPGSWLLIARVGGEAAGFALLRRIADEAELLLVAVRKRFRRHGIARTLLERAAEDALAGGAATLHLEVRDANPALFLYRQAGFVQVGRRRGYYRGRSGKVFDALTFKRQLSVN
jgi:[ribosomal protein S18]-alanine N-acetyltransferase